MSDSLKLRVIEAYPERWLKILPAYPNETEDEYKLRVMNISIPWTRDEDFRKAYLTVEPWDGVLTTKCIMAMLKSIQGFGFNFNRKEKLIELIVSYGFEYVKEFYNSFIQNYQYKPSYFLTFELAEIENSYYVTILARALYRFDRNFYKTMFSTQRYSDAIARGILTECVLANDEITFDAIYRDRIIGVLDAVAQASYYAKNTKYMAKVFKDRIDDLYKRGFSGEHVFIRLFGLLKYTPETLSVGIRTISELFKESLANLFEVTFQEPYILGWGLINIFAGFHLAGLSTSDMIQSVNKIEYQNNQDFLNWLNVEDV